MKTLHEFVLRYDEMKSYTRSHIVKSSRVTALHEEDICSFGKKKKTELVEKEHNFFSLSLRYTLQMNNRSECIADRLQVLSIAHETLRGNMLRRLAHVKQNQERRDLQC